MPLRRPVKTLKQLCISIVVTKVSIYSRDELHDIPPHISEELIQCYNKYVKNPTPFDVYNRNRLMNENMKKLTVVFYRTPKLPATIDSVLKICRSLTDLTCIVMNEGRENEENLTKPDLLTLVHAIPKMITLNIKAGVLDDNVLQAIGDNCPNLESLTLELIKINNDDQATSSRQRRVEVEDNKITDHGLIRFCHSDTQRDSKMKHLDIKNSQVTTVGCLVALHDLKRLKTFNCAGVIDAFKKLFQDSTVLPLPIPTFQLSELPPFRMKNVANGTLNFIRKCCPNLTRFSVISTCNFENDVNELNGCDQLVPLTFICKSPITPDLGDFTSKITHLAISGSTPVNLRLIGLSCLNLIDLTFYNVVFEAVDQPAPPRRSVQLPFAKLERLSLIAAEYALAMLVAELLFLLENSTSLEKLKLHINNWVHDDVILSEMRHFRRLTHFHISYCRRLTKTSILELIRAENNRLRDLTIENCKYITRDDYREIKSVIRENNYLVKTHFVNEAAPV